MNVIILEYNNITNYALTTSLEWHAKKLEHDKNPQKDMYIFLKYLLFFKN